MLKRWMFFGYSVVAYAFFLGTFLYAIGFVGNIAVPRSMDAGGEGGTLWEALLVDGALLALFAIQHSGMARRGFKERWTRLVPRPIERSTYVLFASGALALLFAFWRPIGDPVWATDDGVVTTALTALSLLGFLIVFIGTWHINHFDLFGLRQSWSALLRREPPAPRFVTPGLYRVVRHPIYMGFLIAFWATPIMTIGHLVFAVATTGYVLVAIQLEERDLVRDYGSDYQRYRREVPMLTPLPKRPEAIQRAKMHP